MAAAAAPNVRARPATQQVSAVRVRFVVAAAFDEREAVANCNFNLIPFKLAVVARRRGGATRAEA